MHKQEIFEKTIYIVFLDSVEMQRIIYDEVLNPNGVPEWMLRSAQQHDPELFTVMSDDEQYDVHVPGCSDEVDMKQSEFCFFGRVYSMEGGGVGLLS